METKKTWWLLSSLILVFSLTLFACGGGGGSSSSSSSDAGGTETTTGSVAVLVSDAPSDEFKAIEITITAISLIADDDTQIEIWSLPSGQIVNLLELETEAELFTLASDVPVGLYSKIRLQVSAVELVNFDDSRIDVDVPASGKIDLNPRGQFYVRADETLVVQLDIDANKSIHLANPNHYRLRPVVFIDILTAIDIGRLVRLPGQIVSIDRDNNQFVFSAKNSEFLIHVDSDTVYFGAQGTATTFTDLAVEDLVTVIGHFRIGSDEAQPEFDALVIEEGDYQRLRGVVTVGVDSVTITDDGDDVFVVSLDPATAYYDCFGFAISYADLVNGQRVVVDAIMVDEEYYAALVATCLESVDELAGELEVVEPLTLTIDGQCAEEAIAARYYRLGSDSLTEVVRADLSVGQNVLLYGDDDVCFSYSQLFIIE